MTSVRCLPNKATVDLLGVTLKAPGKISLKTDFGETNSLAFTEESVIVSKELAPSKSLHPIMNGEFLSSALLRVAICARQEGGISELQLANPAI